MTLRHTFHKYEDEIRRHVVLRERHEYYVACPALPASEKRYSIQIHPIHASKTLLILIYTLYPIKLH